MAYWLMKSEPDEFGINDLKRVGIEPWDGISNYQARNMLRDQMQVDDLAFFYHSNCKIPGIAGIMRIHRAGYPDSSAFDPAHPYYDPKSTPEKPRWYRVDVAFVARFIEVIPLSWLREQPKLADLSLLRRGNRLSVMPLTDQHWHFINRHARQE